MKAGYIRCSTNKQDLESQENLLKDWAKRNNQEIILYKDFAISGKTTQREGIDKLLIDAEKKLFDGVVVVELSRIGRSIGFIHNTIERLNKLNIKVILSQTNTALNSQSVEGVALLGGLALAAAVELKLIEERNRRGREKIKRDRIKVGRHEKELSLEAIKLMRAKGMGLRSIGKELGTTAATIMRRLRSLESGHKLNVLQSNQNPNNSEQKQEGVS